MKKDGPVTIMTLMYLSGIAVLLLFIFASAASDRLERRTITPAQPRQVKPMPPPVARCQPRQKQC